MELFITSPTKLLLVYIRVAQAWHCTIHILGPIIPCCGGCPAHCKVLRRSNLYPRDASGTNIPSHNNPKSLQTSPRGGGVESAIG